MVPSYKPALPEELGWLVSPSTLALAVFCADIMFTDVPPLLRSTSCTLDLLLFGSSFEGFSRAGI